MANAEEIDELLSKLFLNLEISELDRARCTIFLSRSGWSGLASLKSADQIRTHLSISRGPATKLAAAVELAEVAGESIPSRRWTLEEICDALRSLRHEELRGIYWDGEGIVVHAQTLAIGSVDAVEISPYFALKPAFIFGSRRITLAHNHPSTAHEHSLSDVASMSRLRAIAASVGIQIDPLVVIANTK